LDRNFLKFIFSSVSVQVDAILDDTPFNELLEDDEDIIILYVQNNSQNNKNNKRKEEQQLKTTKNSRKSKNNSLTKIRNLHVYFPTVRQQQTSKHKN